MSDKKDATLVAGTKSYFKLKDEVGDYAFLPGLVTLGAVGSVGSYVDQTTLDDTTKRYLGGMKDTSESTLKVNVYPDDPNQSKFVQAAQDKRVVQIKNILPPNSSGKQFVMEYEMALAGYRTPEMSDGNTLVQFEVSGRQSGEPSFAFAEAGKVFGISEATVTTPGAVTLTDGDYQVTQGKDMLTSGDGVNSQFTLTVASGAVSAVKSIDNPGLGFLANDTLTVSTIGNVTMDTAAVLTVSKVS
ncbi:TPA: hypothetical protein ACX6NV_000592 [Photobacterium damselae]